MCGIIGYVGQRACKPLLVQGLERLEYRGYDSAGFALLEADGLQYLRAVGNLQRLKRASESHESTSTTGVGHTRWATHGGVTLANAHPLTGCDDAALVDRPQRDRRELPRAQGLARPRRALVLVGDRRRGGRPPDRAPLRRRPRRRLPERLRAARGALLDRRHPPRPPGHPRRRAVPDAVGGRRRGRRDVPGILDRRVPARDAPRAVHRRPPGRRAPPGGCDLPRRGRRDRRARGDRDRLGRRERREVGLRDVHAQGDLRAAGGDPRDDRRPRPRPAADPRGPRPDRARDPEPPADRHRRLRQRLPRRRRRPLHRRGVGAPAGRARHRQRMDLPQPRVDEGHAGDRDLAVRARRATRSTR